MVCEGEELSYAELNRRANRLAHYLREAGASGRVTRSAICWNVRIDIVVAELAILKAGGSLCAARSRLSGRTHGAS